MKKDFRMKKQKMKDGEATVIRHKSGYQTLNIIGKVKIPYSVRNLNLTPIIKAVALYVLGLFPSLLKQGRNSYISSYSLPEFFKKAKPDFITLIYDFTYVISAVDIPFKTILGTVSNNLNSIIEKQILDKLDKEMERDYEESG